MNIGVLFIGGIIFAVYLGLMFYNIYVAHNEQKKNNYPNLTKREIFESYEDSNQEDAK
ncbi:hypothetical protein [Winogradskyella schleiferi]|uniref:hypothetical protein n=1 Tax=Winogradskyella schleiferi TaxID=2686078 RepID=UPI0015BDD9F6|nr:hypothetical protein [Winogradskyella schleiferi]